MPIQPKTWRVCDPWEQVLNAKDIETDDGVFQEDMQIICLLSHQVRNRIKAKTGWKGPMCDPSVAEYNEHLHHPAAEWLEHIRFNRITLRLAFLSFMKAAVNILHGALYLFRYVRLGYKVTSQHLLSFCWYITHCICYLACSSLGACGSQ